MNSTMSPPANAEPRSAPAQKMRSPAPVTITTRTPSSCSTDDMAAARSRTSSALMALAGGRSSVMTAKASSRSRRRVSNAIDEDALQEDRGHRLGRVAQAIRALAEHPRGRDLVHRAEQHLGGELDRHVRTDQAVGDALLQDVADQREIG